MGTVAVQELLRRAVIVLAPPGIWIYATPFAPLHNSHHARQIGKIRKGLVCESDVGISS